MVASNQQQQQQQGVSLSPKAMVDLVADWSLQQVVDHLRKKEKEDKSDSRLESDCRLFCRSGIRFFDSIVAEIALSYGVSKGKMCRWLSYHGVAMAGEDAVVGHLSEVYRRIRRLSLAENNPDIADIMDNLIPYSPLERSTDRVSFYVYSSWVQSEFNDLAQICGVYAGQVAQVFMSRSLLTCDLPTMDSVVDRLRGESDRWDRWMRFRAGVLDIAVAVWGSL